MKYYLLESHKKKQHRNTLITKEKQRKAKRSNFLMFLLKIATYKLNKAFPLILTTKKKCQNKNISGAGYEKQSVASFSDFLP